MRYNKNANSIELRSVADHCHRSSIARGESVFSPSRTSQSGVSDIKADHFSSQLGSKITLPEYLCYPS